MTRILARLIFETSPWGPGWAALLSGFATIGFDGMLYLTDAGQEYLEHHHAR